MKQALWEAVKEPLRLMILAVIPILLAYFQTISYEWAGIIVVMLRLIDSILHEIGKVKDNDTLITGLTRF